MERAPLPAAPGLYHFKDSIGSPAERLEVVDDAGELFARFDDEDGGALVPVVDMAGTWLL